MPYYFQGTARRLRSRRFWQGFLSLIFPKPEEASLTAHSLIGGRLFSTASKIMDTRPCSQKMSKLSQLSTSDCMASMLHRLVGCSYWLPFLLRIISYVIMAMDSASTSAVLCSIVLYLPCIVLYPMPWNIQPIRGQDYRCIFCSM